MEGSTFREMLLADAPQLTDEQLDACQADLVSMEEEGFSDEAAAYRIWLTRLGGKGNIPSYADVMVAQTKRNFR